MKLARYGPIGIECPGLIDPGATPRDLSGHVVDLTPDVLAPDSLDRLLALNFSELPVVPDNPRLCVPIAGTRQFIAIGLNYSDHAAETGQATPGEPIVFTKAVSCLQGPDDYVRQPVGSTKIDWEVELGIVIGRQASYVSRENALSFIAGYVVVDDLSERAFQMERGGHGTRAKVVRPSVPSDHGWSLPMKSATCKASQCGLTSMAIVCRRARPRR